MPPINGHIGYYPHTREGVNITFQCNVGYVPSITRTATCDRHGRWIPALQEHNCTIITGIIMNSFLCSLHSYDFSASINLTLLEQNTLREDIDCPGDTVSYNCSILSNSENVHLYWNVTFPGLMPISIFYDNTSNVNIMDYWPMNISSILLDYRRGEYIESIIVLTVLQNFSMNGTELICGITDLINESVIVLYDSSGMFVWDGHILASLPEKVYLFSLTYKIDSFL